MSSLGQQDAHLPSARSYPTRWRTWAAVLLLVLIPLLLFRESLLGIHAFWDMEEYSHGYLIPFIAAFMIWQRRQALAQEPFAGSWWGPVVVLAGLIGCLLGQLSAITSVDLYSFWLVAAGAVLALYGVRGFGIALPALFLLVMAIPLPSFLYGGLSGQLQLISSELGVAVIRLFGVSVHLEGNVIDLGAMKLQVVEACNGLRYLFPLVTLGYIAACFFRAPLWMRAVLVVSTVPITVLMNSFRIGMIGVLVDRYGPAQAEGFLHDFEGWVIFMACMGVLFLLMWALVRVSGDRRPFGEIFALDTGAPLARSQSLIGERSVPASAWTALVLLLIAAIPIATLPQRQEIRPEREQFAAFPMQMEAWHGRRERLESFYLDVLKLDDYEKAAFVKDGAGVVNLYSAYYASQRTGQSAHSPRSCLPGGGWKMEQFDQHAVNGVELGGVPLMVNRTLIKQGEEAQLVYYWFQQRGRTITNEYLVKWYIFVDALLRNRTDGALVRLITPLARGEEVASADRRLTEFAGLLSRELPKYVPD